MERLSGDYNRGYTKAIQDTIEIFEYVQRDLIGHKKRMNFILAMKLLRVILMEREKIRDDWGGVNGFVRYNKQTNNFEYFISKKAGDQK